MLMNILDLSHQAKRSHAQSSGETQQQGLCIPILSILLLMLQADVENQGKVGKPKIDRSKAVPRAAAGQKWYDSTLSEWPENDFRIFVGDMGNEVNDDILTKSFTKYASFQKAKIVRDKHSNKSKGK